MSNYLIEDFQKRCHEKNVTTTYESYTNREYGEQLLKNVLYKNKNRNFANNFTDIELEFINSDCVCDYIKEYMMICLRNSEDFKEEQSEAMALLKGEKTFNEMDADEIAILVEELGDSRGFHRVPGLYQRYLLTISGKGVNEYLLNQVDKYDIAQEFLQTSGLSTRAAYYGGLGVRYCDLGPDNLKSIYYKFLRLNPQLAVEFYKMVISMETLGATEFIDTFYRFARNDFKLEGLIKADNNVVSDQASHNDIFFSAFVALGNRQSRDDQIRLSNNMKYSFFCGICESIKEIDVELYKEHMNAARKRELEWSYDNPMLYGYKEELKKGTRK